MTGLRVWLWRIAGFLFGRRSDSALDEEIQSHLELLAAEHRRSGLSERDARLAARRDFGGVDQIKEAHREQRSLPLVDSIVQDLRFAVRTFRRTPLVTCVCLLTLAVGIGANATVFTIVNAELFRGLPFDEPERIVAVFSETARGDRIGLSHEDFEDVRDQARSFSDLVATLTPGVNLGDDVGVADRVQGTYVSWNLFRMIGQRPVLGRDFRAEDDRRGAEPVVMLGYALWQNRYGGAADVLGRTIRVNTRTATVIGVMPRGLEFPDRIALWIPRAILPATSFSGRGYRNFTVLGRLAPGVSVQQARAELNAIAARLAREYPNTNQALELNLQIYQDTLGTASTRLIYLSLMGAVGFVLLIACANVANLLMVRAAGRSREIAIRLAQGAGRARIVRQLLVESILLAATGGIFGLFLSLGAVRWFDRATVASGRPYWMYFTFDPIVFAFVAAICVATGMLFGLAPALQVSKTDVNEILKEGGRGGSGLRSRRWTATLVVVELVLTLVLLSSAGFMVRSFLNLYRMNLGFDAANLSVMKLYLPVAKYARPAQVAQLHQSLQDRLKTISTIQSNALASSPPAVGSIRGVNPDGWDSRGVALDGRMPGGSEPAPNASVVEIGDDYFATLRIPILSGRPFGPGDGLPERGAAIVNKRFADIHFSGVDPIGHTVRLVESADWLTIVGVVSSIRQRSLTTPEPDPVVYVPLRAEPRQGVVALLVRAPASPARVATLVRQEMRTLDPDIPIYEVQTMDEVLADRRWQSLVYGSMFAAFGGIALLLAAVGLYAVTAYSVSERTQEIGVRIALGERPRQVIWLVVRRALIELVIGLPIGIAGSLAVGKLLESVLVRTSPRDPTTLLIITVTMIAVVAFACVWPARRAARLNPLIALRYE